MNDCLRRAVIVAYGRSAIARAGKKGYFRNLHPVTLGGLTLKGVLEQKLPQLNPAELDDVIVGCAQQDDSQSYNIARLVVQRAGLPDSVCGLSINRFCSSGLQAIALAASQIACGMAQVVVAGGVESMTKVPVPYDHTADYDPWQVEHTPEVYISNGITAENVARRHGITRGEMDQMALESHRRAAAAQDAGRFDDEIIPLPGVDENGDEILVTRDQGIRRDTTAERLAGLKPCFLEGGAVTAGSSSQTSDGAAFVVCMSEEKARALGLTPIARLVGFAAAGCEAAYMGEGPMYAVPKVMEQTGLRTADMDVIELNEAFAAQAIPCIRTLGLDPARVNPNGGAIALGHPLGATGAFLTCKVLSELKRTGGRYGLVTMCIGGGMGAAGIYEMC